MAIPVPAMDQRSSIFILRLVACAVILVGIIGFLAQLRSMAVLNAISAMGPLSQFVIAGGISAILLGISSILQTRQHASTAPTPGAMAENQLIELLLRVQDLSAAVERLARQTYSAPVAGSDDVVRTQSTGAPPEVLRALQTLFEELRDLSLLTDEQRQRRSAEMTEERKQAAIASAHASIQLGQWATAESSIGILETEWPSDPLIAKTREALEASRQSAEERAIEVTQAQIESEMSLSHWEQAVELAQNLVAEFPASTRAAQMLGRVRREFGIYTETTVGRLYDEIRHDVERRVWRRALGHAQQLIANFPDHPRSELIRKQIHTIQDNAEIEERQEQESRIGELIRARRFREAIGLSEDLINRFPASRQAEAINKLLPRVRQLADEAESQAPESSTI